MLNAISFVKRKKNDDGNDQFISTIRGLRFTMIFFGIWPRASSQIWCNLIWFVQSLGLGFAMFGPIAGMIAYRHETRIVIDLMGLLFPMGCTCIKWISLARHRTMVKELLHSMAEDWSNLEGNNSIIRNVPDSKVIMLKYARMAKIYFFTYVTMMSVAIVNYVHDSVSSISSHNNNTDPNDFLVIPNSWYPLDYNRNFNVQFLVVTQSITSSEVALANAAMDSILVTMTLHLCGQFRILRYFIEGIGYDSSEPQYCETKIRLMVNRHKELLGVGKRIQETYSYVILAQSVACTLSICLLGYSFLAEMDRSDVRATILLKAGFICGATLQTMFTYCHVGDCLVNESIAVAMAIYNTQWYNFTRSINYTCLIVMIRARTPIALTGAKFVSMSLETFTSLMKAAASYLSVLRAMDIGQG